MHKRYSRNRIMALLLGVAALAWAGWASADPPTRVARLGYISGAVSFSPAGEDDWVLATVNRPLITGDRLWVDAGARAELQIGAAVIRMSGSTSVTLLNLEDRVAQVQLAQGTLNVRVRRLGPQEVFEVATPNLAYSIRRPGEYRIDVDPAGDTTAVVVRSGQAEVYGDGAAYVVNAQQAYRFAGTGLSDYEYIEAPRADEFDRWSSDRDRRGAVSARYVSRDVIGYEDLDDYGSWRAAEGYGNVWVPTRVAAGWAPYHDGHWAWVDPWGWTWVDDAPWGFAVSHYGRWANIRGTWGWVPGPIRSRAVYAPALVAFVGGSNFQIAISIGNVAGVAWFPLGPRDVYRPSYPVSRSYFNNINTSNTTINTTNITNVYNNINVRNITYVNQQVPGAIVAVPSTAFVQSQPVGRAAVRLPKEAIATAPVTAVAAVAPVQASVRGAAAPSSRPPAEALKRPVVARVPPPPAPVPFAAKQSALAAQPGRPLDAAALAAVKPTARAPAPSVKVVSPTQRAVAPPKQQAAGPERPQAPEATKAPQPPEAKKGLRAREAQEAPQPPEARKAPQPAVSVPRPPEAQKAPQPPEAQKRPQRPEAQEAPKPPEARKAPQPAVSVPRPPEAQKAPQPPEAPRRPQRPEVQKAPRPPEARKAQQPPVSVPKPPEAQKAPQPPEAQKRPQRPEVQEVPRPPVSVPKPPAAQKAPPPKPEAAKSAEKRGAKKSDEQPKREEEERTRRQ
ncbi:MAG: hypothetical protein A3F74_05760 [Betaproteobacteria bacterium RIFCSPLOWO2_12_FULL_62_58]|nr:MAG: hypothetical protein A3F74_05760 [Betaproteobacteria bacterium RIFCSPLOWO2_12_FULL_62_58]